MSRAITTDPVLEAMIEAEVTEALQPHQALFEPEELEELRHLLRIALRTHPTARHLLEQLGPRASPDQSGKEDVSVFRGPRSKKAQGE